MAKLKSSNQTLDTHFTIGIHKFLLNNKFAVQFYLVLKETKILLKNKKNSVYSLRGQLHHLGVDSTLNLSKFFENFVLIWDLLKLECPELQFSQLRQRTKKPLDLFSISSAIIGTIYKTKYDK
jgi:hypothetical protein